MSKTNVHTYYNQLKTLKGSFNSFQIKEVTTIQHIN